MGHVGHRRRSHQEPIDDLRGRALQQLLAQRVRDGQTAGLKATSAASALPSERMPSTLSTPARFRRLRGVVAIAASRSTSARGDWITKHAWSRELFIEAHCAHAALGLVHLDALRASEPHDPNVPGAGAQEVGDLLLKLGLVPTAIGVLERQRRRALGPARPSPGRDTADAHIGRSKGLAVVHLEARVDTGVLDIRVAGEHERAVDIARAVTRARGRAANGVPIGQSIRITVPQVTRMKRPCGERGVDANVAPGVKCTSRAGLRQGGSGL